MGERYCCHLICLSIHHKTLYIQHFPLKWEFLKTLHACLLVFTIWRFPYHYRSLIGPFLKQKIAIFHLQYFIKILYVHFEWELFKICMLTYLPYHYSSLVGPILKENIFLFHYEYFIKRFVCITSTFEMGIPQHFACLLTNVWSIAYYYCS